jgi:hypothetical protein
LSQVKASQIVRDLWGLFVDDGSLAIGLVVWCGLAALVLPRVGLAAGWDGPVLYLGCAVVLVENAWRSARRSGRG